MTAIDDWVAPTIRALRAYPVPDAHGLIKLDAMESPYGWETAQNCDHWLQCLRAVALNRYPNAAALALKANLRVAMGVPDGMDIVLGNGSDELIQMLALLVGGPGRVILAPEPGFVMYAMIAKMTHSEYCGIPLRASGDFALDTDAMLAAIAQHRPALIFLAYPNNPTGNLFARPAIEAILRAAPGLVVVDEAYCAFADDSFMADLGRYDNLLVMRTLSKVGLAGIRLGMLAGPPVWLHELEKLRLPYNINSMTQATALYMLENYSTLLAQTQRIRAQRQWLYQAIAALPAYTVWPSQANFLLMRAGNGPELFNLIKNNGILVKNLHGAHPTLAHCLRLTIGTPEENQALLRILEQHATVAFPPTAAFPPTVVLPP